MSRAMSLKAKIRNIAKQKNIPAQVILQNYMFERLLVRLAVSDYKEKFVLKGGMLVAAIVGLDNRATMDLDTTVKSLPLTPEAITNALQSVCTIQTDDDVTFDIGTVTPIRDDDIYGGYRVMLNAKYDTIVTPLSIDISTGDAITPNPVEYAFSEIFDDEKYYRLWAYNIETVMAEKVETILRRGVFNTRPRDFYDAHILATKQKFDKAVFVEALKATAAHRGTTEQIADTPTIMKNIEESVELRVMWDKYRDIDFWKTLANWYTEYDRTKSFSHLILSTTANISSSSCFQNWNELNKKDKLEIVRNIGSVKKEKEETFRHQYDRIFNESYNEENLLDILGKFTIESSQSSLKGISNVFSKYIRAIPEANRDGYIGALLGRILKKITDPPHKWEFTKKEFDEICQVEAAAYGTKGNIPLPNDFAKSAMPNNETSALERKWFVQAIKEIEYDPDTLNLEYFGDKSVLPCKDVQTEIECALGLFVTNMGTDADQVKKKASLRNMVSYLFQHQNLMASKFALFYRFSDYYKRKDVIEQFPVFAGMISQEYYSDLIHLNTLKAQLKQKQKKQKTNEKGTAYIKETLLPLMTDYFALLEQEFDKEMSVPKMLKLASNLPVFDETQLFGEEKIATRYKELTLELEELRDKERDVLLKIKNTEGVSNAGTSFSNMLNDLKQQTSVAEITASKYTCPLCGHDCKEISENDSELIEAADWLDEELLLTERYTADFSEDLRKLKDAHLKIDSQIKDVWKQIKTIEEKFISSKKLVSKREKVNYAKARIALYAEMSNSGVFENVDDEINALKEQIGLLEKKIKGFDVDAKKAKAQAFLAENMNRLAQTLDFEEEYRPLNLNFGLLDESFDIYQHQNDREKIHLYEMGSGANWVSCHIALFLSFLRYFASQEKSPMPLIMFFDQPSQVYFPQGHYEGGSASQADLVAVNNMYQTIFDEINSIGKDVGILPQIIIVDHVDGSSLESKDEFEKYVRRCWRNDNGLI